MCSRQQAHTDGIEQASEEPHLVRGPAWGSQAACTLYQDQSSHHLRAAMNPMIVTSIVSTQVLNHDDHACHEL